MRVQVPPRVLDRSAPIGSDFKPTGGPIRLAPGLVALLGTSPSPSTTYGMGWLGLAPTKSHKPEGQTSEKQGVAGGFGDSFFKDSTCFCEPCLVITIWQSGSIKIRICPKCRTHIPSTKKVSTRKVSASEISENELYADEDSSSKVSVDEASPCKVCTKEVRPSEVCAIEVRVSEVCATKVSTS